MTYDSAEKAHISSYRCQIGLYHGLKHSQRVMHWDDRMDRGGERKRCFGTVKVDYFLRRLNGFSTKTSQLRQCLPLYRRTPPSGLLFCRTDVIISIHQFVSTDSYAMKTGDVFQDNASAATVHGYLEPAFAYCAEMAKRIGHDAHGGLPTAQKVNCVDWSSTGTRTTKRSASRASGSTIATVSQPVPTLHVPDGPKRSANEVSAVLEKTKVKCGLLGVHDVSSYFSMLSARHHVSWTARTGVSCLETEINCSVNSSHASGSVNVFRNSVSFNGLRLYSDLDPKTCKFALTYRQLLDDLVLAANGSIRLNVQGSDLKRNAIRLLEQSQHVYTRFPVHKCPVENITECILFSQTLLQSDVKTKPVSTHRVHCLSFLRQDRLRFGKRHHIYTSHTASAISGRV
ncbi:hypothetical protein J6590_096203 [Homalodisca vitripennis]|nr:hypothetical protein J6590_096203 [Homalodisca vitripennis]